MIDAALEAFDEYGYDTATTRDIANRAGCSETLLFRYFGGKRGLLLAVIARLLDDTKTSPLLAESKASSLQEEIEDILRGALDRYWVHRRSLKVIIAESITDPDLGSTLVQSVHREGLERVKERLRWHLETDGMPDADLTALANGVQGIGHYLGFQGQLVWTMDRDELRKIAVRFARILTLGIAAATATSRGAQTVASRPLAGR